MTGEEVNALSCARRGSSCILEDVSSHSDAVAQADQGLLGSSSPEVFKNLFPLSIFCEEQRSTFWEQNYQAAHQMSKQSTHLLVNQHMLDC